MYEILDLKFPNAISVNCNIMLTNIALHYPHYYRWVIVTQHLLQVSCYPGMLVFLLCPLISKHLLQVCNVSLRCAQLLIISVLGGDEFLPQRNDF